MTANNADIDLVKRLKQGDELAFDLIFEKYSGKIFLFGMKYLKNKDEAEELVQSVLLKVWEHRLTLIQESSFKSYLFTIAYHDICKIFNKRIYHQEFVKEVLYLDSQVSTKTETTIENKFNLELVLNIVDKLPKKKHAIIFKSWLEGKSTKEIAKDVGLSAGTVDNYISESLKFIKNYIGKE